MQLVGQVVLEPVHRYPVPQAAPAAFGENVHVPLVLQPVHVLWQVPAAGAQVVVQQLPEAPPPVSAPHVCPEMHSRHDATLHVVAVVPAVVSHEAPAIRRATQVPAPLQ